MRSEPKPSTIRALLAPLLVGSGLACSTVQFDREPGVDHAAPLASGSEVLVVGSMKEVPGGSQMLGLLRSRRSTERPSRAMAEKQLAAEAARRGCDVMAELREQRFDGPPRRFGSTDEYEWQARCVRTSVAAEASAPPPPAPAPAKEETSAKFKNEHARLQAEVAAAKEAARKAAKLAADKEEQLREYADQAEKEKKKQAVADQERQKRERDQAEKEKQRAASDAADRARGAEKALEKARAAAEAAEKERKKLALEAADRAKAIVEAATPANFKAAAEAGEKARVAAENADKAKAAVATAEKDAKAAAEEAATKARALDNDKARADALERERKAREEAEHKAKEEAERKAHEESERRAETERKARDDADRRARDDAERKGAAAAPPPPPPILGAGVSTGVAPAAPAVVDRGAAARADKEAKAAILAEKKRQELEKKRLEAEAKRQEAEIRRQEVERKKAEAAEKKKKVKEPLPAAPTDVDLALRDGSINALLDHMARYAEADPRIVALLDKKVVDAQSEWVVIDGVVVSTVEEERGPKFDADAVAKAVEEAHATGSRFLTPREYSYRYTLKNPASRPVALDVELPGQRLRRVLAAGQQVAVPATVACIPHGAVTTRMAETILEFHFECNADSSARVLSVRPIERELLLDRRAADPDVPLDVINRIWQALPGTSMTTQYVAMIDDAVRRRGEALGDISGRVAAQHKSSPEAPTSVLVTLRNGTPHDATVVFDVGTGKEQRLIIARGQSQEMKLDVPAGVTPELKILGLLPRLRSLDWLLGVWSFKGARVALLPAERGQWTAYLLPPDGARVVAVGLRFSDGLLQARANAPAAFVKAIYGADTTASCQEGCELKWLLRVADFDQYVTGAGRALPVEFEAGDRRALVKFSAEH